MLSFSVPAEIPFKTIVSWPKMSTVVSAVLRAVAVADAPSVTALTAFTVNISQLFSAVMSVKGFTDFPCMPESTKCAMLRLPEYTADPTPTAINGMANPPDAKMAPTDPTIPTAPSTKSVSLNTLFFNPTFLQSISISPDASNECSPSRGKHRIENGSWHVSRKCSKLL
uniref:(northern house mosquito) hypothetical protein n=1 Tax=Culex pipiens TaxID=7175 RepID=A0A8D8G0U6_CULPI